MLRTIVLHGDLATQFGDTFTLDVRSPAEAMRALVVQVRGFRRALRDGHYRVLKATSDVAHSLGLDELNLRVGPRHEIHVVPVIAGSANAWGKILAGVAIVALAVAAPYALGIAGGLGTATGLGLGASIGGVVTFGQIAGFGALVALGGVAQMLSPTISASSSGSNNKESYLFGSTDNVTTEGGPVPLVFGEFVVGSVVVSAGLSTEETALAAGVTVSEAIYRLLKQ